MKQTDEGRTITSVDGEGWFPYWRLPQQLWKSNIEHWPKNVPVIIPINPGFHTESGIDPDFGLRLPETDFKRLLLLLNESERSFRLLLPLGPVPFMSRGGLPSQAATSPLETCEGLRFLTADSSGRLHHLYSFYDQKVWEIFRSFCESLEQYFERNEFVVSVVGLDAGYEKDGNFVPYFRDFSPAFHQAYSRYLKKNFPTQEVDLASDQEMGHLAYETWMRSLYLDTAREIFGNRWGGERQVCFLEGRPMDIFSRAMNFAPTVNGLLDTARDISVMDVVSSIAILPGNHRDGELAEIWRNFVAPSFSPPDEEGPSSRPLKLIYVCEDDGVGRCSTLGIKSIIDKNYPWTCRLKKDFSGISDTGCNGGVVVYLKKELSTVEFVNIQKLFLAGQSVLLSRESFSAENWDGLNLFFIENRIETTEIHLAGKILCASVGEGNLMVFEANKVAELALDERSRFWSHIFSLLVKTDIRLEADDEVMFNWKNHKVRSQDKKLQEIRRLNLYNSGIDRKRVSCLLPSEFTFLHSINSKLAKVSKHENSISVELPSHATVSLEFTKGGE